MYLPKPKHFVYTLCKFMFLWLCNLRCGMGFVNQEELKLPSFVNTWIAEKCGAMGEETRDCLLELKYVENTLRFIQKRTQECPR